MKALLLESARKLSLKDIPPPVAREGCVLIDVEATSIGGSEYLGYNAPGIRPLPTIMGHGFTGWLDGQRVAINPVQGCKDCIHCLANLPQLCDSWSLIGVQTDGGFVESVSVPEDSVFHLPDSISWEQSVFVEPFANSLNAWEISGATKGDFVAIIGSGSLGLGLVVCAKRSGCQSVYVSEPSSPRLAAAIGLGAKEVDPAESYNFVFDTVGSEESRKTALELCGKQGTVVLLGFASPIFETNAGALIRDQKRIIGSFAYSSEQFEKSIDLAKDAKSDWVQNISFHDVEALLEDYLDGDFSVVKAALRPRLR